MSQKKKWQIDYAESALSDIRKLDGSVKKLIKKAIEDKLMSDPLTFGLPLRANLANLFKLRVGSYRIIYQIKKTEVVVLVVAVGHRRDVYDE